MKHFAGKALAEYVNWRQNISEKKIFYDIMKYLLCFMKALFFVNLSSLPF